MDFDVSLIWLEDFAEQLKDRAFPGSIRAMIPNASPLSHRKNILTAQNSLSWSLSWIFRKDFSRYPDQIPQESWDNSPF
jgi:hypothetical protein